MLEKYENFVGIFLFKLCLGPISSDCHWSFVALKSDVKTAVSPESAPSFPKWSHPISSKCHWSFVALKLDVKTSVSPKSAPSLPEWSHPISSECHWSFVALKFHFKTSVSPESAPPLPEWSHPISSECHWSFVALKSGVKTAVSPESAPLLGCKRSHPPLDWFLIIPAPCLYSWFLSLFSHSLWSRSLLSRMGPKQAKVRENKHPSSSSPDKSTVCTSIEASLFLSFFIAEFSKSIYNRKKR